MTSRALAIVVLLLPACIEASERFPATIPTPCSDAPACPSEMVQVVDDDGVRRAEGVLEVSGGRCVCLDRYEASRGSGDVAESKANSMPWVNVSFEEAQAACTAAGKRLCNGAEWTAGCTGLPATPFPYGAELDTTACNATSSVAATGKSTRCEGGWPELFDMSGNVAEWAAQPSDPTSCSPNLGCAAYGGSAAGAPTELACGYRAGLTPRDRTPTIGFRCCKAP